MVATQQMGSLQLLLTDVVMPGMSGKGLSQHLRVIKPDLKLLFMSGYTDDVGIGAGSPPAPTSKNPLRPRPWPRSSETSWINHLNRPMGRGGQAGQFHPASHADNPHDSSFLTVSSSPSCSHHTFRICRILADASSADSDDGNCPNRKGTRRGHSVGTAGGGESCLIWKPGTTCTDVPPTISRTSTLIDTVSPSTFMPKKDCLNRRPFHSGSNIRAEPLINAELFRDDFTYSDFLQDGQSFGSRRHVSWQGLFWLSRPPPGSGMHVSWISP